jgi:hypothetical protein
MASYCRLCGKQIKEGGDMCEACKENIRAEAMGRHRKIAKQIPKEVRKQGMHDNRKEIEDNQSLATPQDEEEEKKPHHFKSMAEYLEYLKGKESK